LLNSCDNDANHDSDWLKERKSLDIKSRVKRRKELEKIEESQPQSQEESTEQDNVEEALNPLHTTWRFTRKELNELRAKGRKYFNPTSLLLKCSCHSFGSKFANVFIT
jgi:hypothetical protein